MSVLRILGKASSINVRKVLWTCDEIGIRYEREDWGIGFASTKTPEFLAKNPRGLVPVIENEDGILWESNTICRYLAGKYGRTDLLPTDPWSRALVERWMDWQATELNTSWRYAFLALARRIPGYDDPALIAASAGDWNANMGILERHLSAAGLYVARGDFTLADIVIGLSVNRWLQTPIERPDLPAVSAYFDRLRQRPTYIGHGTNDIA
ncbi:glutathione S-transferase [Neorhizobium sp. P12A]|uniref:glutathione S-transferase family protein n=1 Tax=Neorhizobium sp. P12A TaxID=2268027 RepID=UPI0011EFF663|nr:glutathione S-transferase [Neorhizobium sp. P12A]KAA0701095.1 glutathione S-transferase [Neorhizobium sp. P12A]